MKARTTASLAAIETRIAHPKYPEAQAHRIVLKKREVINDS